MTSRDSNPTRAFGKRTEPHRITITKGPKVRSFTFRPWVAGATIGVIALFGTGYLGATAYLVFRDQIASANVARQARMQHEYEDRISALRAELERITSRQLINQAAVETKIDVLLERKASLDDRDAALLRLFEKAKSVGLNPPIIGPQPQPKPGETAAASPGASPSSDKAGGNPFDSFNLRLSSADFLGEDTAPAKAEIDLAALPPQAAKVIGRIESDFDQIEVRQATLIGLLAARAAESARQAQFTLAKLGYKVEDGEADVAGGSVGGPYEPAPQDRFHAQLQAAERAIDELAAIKKSTRSIPLRRPISSGASVTSTFGTRVDPFLRRPAMHSGIDFKADYGHAVAATGNGIVIHAGYSGGYGKLVEIDHGDGVTSRYAHLSRISVKVGDKVMIGQPIGRLGNTGRSTGPHLHYEIRINGNAVNPNRFLVAGSHLRPLL